MCNELIKQNEKKNLKLQNYTRLHNIKPPHEFYSNK